MGGALPGAARRATLMPPRPAPCPFAAIAAPGTALPVGRRTTGGQAALYVDMIEQTCYTKGAGEVSLRFLPALRAGEGRQG